jgi:transcriptional regulator with XRE-family HTH domain
MPRRRVPIRQSELVKRFAERLRELRQSRGITQADLARKATITASYVSRLEGGKVAPGIDMVERLASVLATSVTDLLPTNPPPDPLPVLQEQAKEMLNTLLDKGGREVFLRLNPFLAFLVEAATKRSSNKS